MGNLRGQESFAYFDPVLKGEELTLYQIQQLLKVFREHLATLDHRLDSEITAQNDVQWTDVQWTCHAKVY